VIGNHRVASSTDDLPSSKNILVPPAIARFTPPWPERARGVIPAVSWKIFRSNLISA
jgi:hypothetical protein